MKEDDQLPQAVCDKCVEKIEDFHSYTEQVIQNQSVLQTIEQIEKQEQMTTIVNSTGEYIKIEMPNGTILTDGSQIYKIEGLNVIAQTGNPSTDNIIILGSKNIEDFKNEQLNNISTEIVEECIIPDSGTTGMDDDDEKLDNKFKIKVIESPKKKKVRVKTIGDLRSSTQKKIENSYGVDVDQDYDMDGSDSDDSLTYDEPKESRIKTEKRSGRPKKSEEDGEDSSDDDNDSKFVFPNDLIQDSQLVVRGKKLMKLLSRFYRLECDLCPAAEKIFKKIGDLCAHYIECHSIKGYVMCCGIKLIKIRAMALHMCRHIQPDAFTCSECGKLMTCPKILQYHMQNHLPEEKRPLACPECPRRFSYSSALVAHTITHQPEEERVAHVCEECGKSFSSPGRLSTHINVVHTKHDQVYVCHICAKSFGCKGNLVYHLTTHQPRVHQVQCTQCGKWLKNKLCLRKHMIQHSGIKYLCELCDYAALNPQCLRNHMRVQHTDDKPFKCDLCERSFKLKNTLLNHLVQHTGIKKFACQFCSRTFASSGNYYAHRKRMHPQELAILKSQQEEQERCEL